MLQEVKDSQHVARQAAQRTLLLLQAEVNGALQVRPPRNHAGVRPCE